MIGIFNEAVEGKAALGEKRVACVPEVVGRLVADGWPMVLEQGAGQEAGFSDAAFEQAGARMVKSVKQVSEVCSLFLTVGGWSLQQWCALPDHALVVGCVGEVANEVTALIKKKSLVVCDLFRLPRISRAQAMDVLSSQSTVAGYAAALEAAHRVPGLFPLLMTAAGSLPAAKVFVWGVGVAGLQAIATAKRLGAAVTACDLRPEVAEQVKSLGATFLPGSLSPDEDQKTALKRTLAATDVIITAALVPGRKAPTLLTKDLFKLLKPGAVVVDMAAAAGGNCAVTQADETRWVDGVCVVGATNWASRYSRAASTFYANNLRHFLDLLFSYHHDEKKDWREDEILRTVCEGDLDAWRGRTSLGAKRA